MEDTNELANSTAIKVVGEFCLRMSTVQGRGFEGFADLGLGSPLSLTASTLNGSYKNLMGTECVRISCTMTLEEKTPISWAPLKMLSSLVLRE